jgi:hypothetical protein
LSFQSFSGSFSLWKPLNNPALHIAERALSLCAYSNPAPVIPHFAESHWVSIEHSHIVISFAVHQVLKLLPTQAQAGLRPRMHSGLLLCRSSHLSLHRTPTNKYFSFSTVRPPLLLNPFL